MTTIHIPGRPVPCPRPRVTKRGVFYPNHYEAWKAEAGLRANVAVGQPLRGPVAVSVLVNTDARYGDADNYAKSALDAVQHVAFVGGDDRVVSDLYVSRRCIEPLGMEITLNEHSDAAMYAMARRIIERTAHGMAGFLAHIEAQS